MHVSSRASRRKACLETIILILIFLVICSAISSCQKEARKRAQEKAETAAAEAALAAGIEAAESGPRALAEIHDQRALIPDWYRSRLRISTSGNPPVTSVSLVPLWRMVAFGVTLVPILFMIAFNPFSNRFQDDVWEVKGRTLPENYWTGIGLTLGFTLVAFIVPLVLVLPINLLLRVPAYAMTGAHYYLPWHFLLFLMYGLIVAVLGIATLRWLAQAASCVVTLVAGWIENLGFGNSESIYHHSTAKRQTREFDDF